MKKKIQMIAAVALLMTAAACSKDEPNTVKITGVTLNKTSLTLFTGDKDVLTATITPADITKQNLTWESSNETVAGIDDNGEVTAMSAGTAVITVTAEDGNKTATCNVTVNPNVYVVSCHSLNVG